MNREEAVKILHEALPGLRQRYGVLDLGLFESVARNEAGPDSDVDILVTLTQSTDFFTFMDLQFELEGLLGKRIDLVTPKALKPRTRLSIERDLIHVA